MTEHNRTITKENIMADVMKLKTPTEYPVIVKIIDGKEIECVDIDSLTEDQFKRFCRNTGTEWFQRMSFNIGR